MKKIKSLILIISIAFTTTSVLSQANPSAGILPLNAGGVVEIGAIMDIKVTINNTLTGTIVASKLRPNVTIPSIATILPNAQQTGLPPGWVIVSNAGGQIRVCNASDPIGGNEQRDIIIKVEGTTVGGPTACQVQINFGGATCAVSGPQPNGNVTVDDFAASSVTVIAAPLPLTLLNFNATLLKCEPSLTWVTESEINTDRFEIERSGTSGNDWKLIGTTAAKGSANLKNNYNFIDKDFDISLEKILYRLKMIDKDGKFKYSFILPVLVNCKTVKAFVYPNPVQDDKLFVSLAGTVGNADATLISTSGQIILRSKMINGTNNITVSTIANGIYILNIKDANGFDKNIKVSIKH